MSPEFGDTGPEYNDSRAISHSATRMRTLLRAIHADPPRHDCSNLAGILRSGPYAAPHLRPGLTYDPTRTELHVCTLPSRDRLPRPSPPCFVLELGPGLPTRTPVGRVSWLGRVLEKHRRSRGRGP